MSDLPARDGLVANSVSDGHGNHARLCGAGSTSSPTRCLDRNVVDPGWPIQLAATANGADLRTPCTAAHFPALRLDDSLTFQARGVFTAAGGLVSAHVGDSTSIAGRVDGLRVIVGAFTLVRGGSGPVVCNA